MSSNGDGSQPSNLVATIKFLSVFVSCLPCSILGAIAGGYCWDQTWPLSEGDLGFTISFGLKAGLFLAISAATFSVILKSYMIVFFIGMLVAWILSAVGFYLFLAAIAAC